MSGEKSPGRIPEAEALPGSTSKLVRQNGGFVNAGEGVAPTFEGIEGALSTARFGRYLEAAGHDRALALQFYALNSSASNALFPLLQNLEVALRNGFHLRLTARYGEGWLDELGVITEVLQRRMVSDAKLELIKTRKALDAGHLVAALSFGFWTACLSAQYEDRLWRRGGLAQAFSVGGSKPKRNQINRALTPIRLLRNRIAHHEPILHLNLTGHREKIIQLTSWLSPVMAEWSLAHCRFGSAFDPDLAAKFLRTARNRNNSGTAQERAEP